jgi:hypothetical protein
VAERGNPLGIRACGATGSPGTAAETLPASLEAPSAPSSASQLQGMTGASGTTERRAQLPFGVAPFRQLVAGPGIRPENPPPQI